MLRIENLRAGYNGSEALHSVSINIERGTIVSVVGANGAGKSTLINAVSRLVSMTSGAIWLEDKNITGLNPAHVFENGILQVP
jgi:branched-chain amino acid transport system ATP-binding protein